MESQANRGSLSCVGLGMMLGAHLTPRARSTIDRADVVFVLASDGLVQRWVEEMHPDVRSLQSHYEHGTSRRLAYQRMVAVILAEVRAGRRVCAAFYGHPGVFAQVAHQAIEGARSEAFEARMEPAVSAEDCLYADLGIDPGAWGCQHFEATQFLCTERLPDTSALLVLWQAAVVGDRGFSLQATGRAHRALLVDKLMRSYPALHPVVIYEAPTVATATPRVDSVALEGLVYAELHVHTTLVLRPSRRPAPDLDVLAALDAIDAGRSRGRSSRPRLVVVNDPVP